LDWRKGRNARQRWRDGERRAPTSINEYLGAIDALRRREAVPSVEDLVGWANSTSSLKAGSLHLHPERWSQLMGPQHPAAIVAAQGSSLKLLPESERPAPRRPWYPPQTQNERDIVEEMTLEALDQGAIRPVYPADLAAAAAAGIPAATVAVFVVSKNKPGIPPHQGCMAACRKAGPDVVKALTKRWRQVADFKTNGVNAMMAHDPYVMGSAKKLRPLVRFRDLTTTTDVRSAYWATFLKRYFWALLMVRPTPGRVTEWLRRHKASMMAYCVPQFGIKAAGKIFSLMLEAALDVTRRLGVRTASIMDDTMTLSNGKDPQDRLTNALCDAGMVIVTLVFLGFPFQLAKNELTPETHRVFGGAVLNTMEMRHFSEPIKVARFRLEWMALLRKLREWKTRLSSTAGAPTLTDLARVCGQVNSLLNEVHGLKARVAPLEALKAGSIRQQTTGRCNLKVNYDAALTRDIPDEAIKALQALCDPKTINRLDGFPLHLQNMKYACVVDSDKASRGYFFGKARSRPNAKSVFFKKGQPQTRFFSSRWSSKHSVYAEPAGAALAVMEEVIEGDIRDCHIRLFTDSTTARSAINKGGSKAPDVSKIFTELGFFELLRSRNVSLTAEHMQGVEMIANGTDKASRQLTERLSPCELQLSRALIHEVEKWAGATITVDLMASAANARAPVFISRRFCPEAAATDAFSQDWKTWWLEFRGTLYCFPPPGQSSTMRALERAEAAQVPLLFVVPLDAACSAVKRALQITSTLPYLWAPSTQTVAYPHRAPLTAWLQERTARRSTSSSAVWMVVNLFSPTPRAGCTAVPWTRPLSPQSRRQWTQSHSRLRAALGEVSCTTAETLVVTLGHRRM
jgi:hypothetical protein